MYTHLHGVLLSINCNCDRRTHVYPVCIHIYMYIVRKHDCRQNYDESAKSMEADMAIEMFERAPEHGMKYTKIVGDEDATTYANLRNSLPEQLASGLEKLSDPNHIKKIIGNRLRDLAKILKTNKKALTNVDVIHIKTQPTAASNQENIHIQQTMITHQESVLSENVIRKLQKDFGYVQKQNVNNLTGMKAGITNIVDHNFGIHTNCRDWCRSKQVHLYINTYMHII